MKYLRFVKNKNHNTKNNNIERQKFLNKAIGTRSFCSYEQITKGLKRQKPNADNIEF